MASVEWSYAYAGASGLDGETLSLVSAQTDALAPTQFLRAIARQPEGTAKALRAVSETVAARYYVPPAMLAKILREADPIATVNQSTVRFEGFSACCSAYIRLDMGPEALEVDLRRSGTTNVDFGPELRAALAQVRAEATLEIRIGAEAVTIAHAGTQVVERKVPLPTRWIKGLSEAQAVQAGMRKAFTLSRVAAQRFLRAISTGKSDHIQWLTLAATQLRSAARQSDGAVPLRGAHRLRVLAPLIGFANSLEVYVHDALGSSAWVLQMGPQRLTVVLNAEPWRGFSGDGGVLRALASADPNAEAKLRAALNWQDRLDAVTLQGSTGLTPPQIETGLARLAALGLVGYDLVEAAYFHRALPFDTARLGALNPRLVAAEKLLAAGAVTLQPDGIATVQSEGVVHQVDRSAHDPRCTCPWYAKHQATRGPCKHILAVEILQEATHDQG